MSDRPAPDDDAPPPGMRLGRALRPGDRARSPCVHRGARRAHGALSVRPLDVAVLVATLAGFVAYGLWRSRGTRDMPGYLVAGRQLPWPIVALSVMATQASAVTFLATPGQGYVGGLSFVQFYFGLPIAMVVLVPDRVPLYQRLRVRTAYEFLEQRFDGHTRTLAAGLFLLQRGLSAGITLYAPALVLSVILGWDLRVDVPAAGRAGDRRHHAGRRACDRARRTRCSSASSCCAMALAFALRAARAAAGTGNGRRLRRGGAPGQAERGGPALRPARALQPVGRHSWAGSSCSSRTSAPTSRRWAGTWARSPPRPSRHGTAVQRPLQGADAVRASCCWACSCSWSTSSRPRRCSSIPPA